MALARKFGAEGAEILMLARNAEKLKAIEEELSGQGIRATGYAADISEEKNYSEALNRIAAEHPTLDILHYNASIYNPVLPSALEYDTFLREIKINVAGAFPAVQTFLPAMKKAGKGTMFFTGGGSALKAPAELVSLSIGKAGLRNLAQCLAEECAPFGIQVATVTINGMVEAGTKYDPEIIAGEFWQLYQQPKTDWKWEIVI